MRRWPALSRLDFKERGLTLPASPKLPPDVFISFERGPGFEGTAHSSRATACRARRDTGPFGKMPSQVGLEAAQESARLTALPVNAGIWQAIGDLDRIAAWAMVNGLG
jgi:hypothetical protein